MKKYILAGLIILNLHLDASSPKSLAEVNLAHPDFILNAAELAVPINQMIVAMNLQEFDGDLSYHVPDELTHEISQSIIDEFCLSQARNHPNKLIIKDVVFRKALFLLQEYIKMRQKIEDLENIGFISTNILTPGEQRLLNALNDRIKNYTDATMQTLNKIKFDELIEEVIARLTQELNHLITQYLARIQQPWLRFLVKECFDELVNNEHEFLENASELFKQDLYNFTKDLDN